MFRENEKVCNAKSVQPREMMRVNQTAVAVGVIKDREAREMTI
jgi:hypothetical protein